MKILDGILPIFHTLNCYGHTEKRRRTFKHIWFCPTQKPNLQPAKELAFPNAQTELYAAKMKIKERPLPWL